MDITRTGERPSGLGPAAWLTGAVRIGPLSSPTDPARTAGRSAGLARPSTPETTAC